MFSGGQLQTLICAGIIGPQIAFAAVASTTQHVVVTLAPAGKVNAPASVTLDHTGSFSSYRGTATVQYSARTASAGSAAINLQGTSDFSPAGGPAISHGALTYSCAGATLGSACGGVQTVSLTAAAPVVAIPAGACTGGGVQCSPTDPNVVVLTLFVDDDPGAPTGAYRAQITFTYSNP